VQFTVDDNQPRQPIVDRFSGLPHRG
jgi:hypothetical protein